jgi:DNA invertase Pin-like site-specific DNA recombinase
VPSDMPNARRCWNANGRGIAKAKHEGRYKGRIPTARRRAAEVAGLKVEGVTASEIARRLGIGRASVYRVLVSHGR